MKKIAVLGSSNLDLVFTTTQLPQAGETVTGQDFSMHLGGKGANQAVALQKLGADVTFFTAVGQDTFATEILTGLSATGLKVVPHRSTQPTGVAQINLYEGDNRILVIPGANHDWPASYLKRIAEQIADFDYFVLQLEIPLPVVTRLCQIIRQFPNKKIILNPAPAQVLPPELWPLVDYLTPNEHELHLLGRRGTTAELLQSSPPQIVVTKGAAGASYFDRHQQKVMTVPALANLKVVDTTGAGDTFNGAFVYQLVQGAELAAALAFANAAAGLATTKVGAQAGMPSAAAVKEVAKRAQLKSCE